jgi:DNA-binding LacI/PurR family transcriptional regulator/biotin operon repressor
MPQPHLVSRLHQAVEVLRQGMVDGRWRGTLPGRQRLARELGCSHGTVEAAMRQLAREGWLVSQGQGRRRRIVIPTKKRKKAPLVKRVRLLAYDELSRLRPEEIALLARLREAGYAADFARKNLHDLKMDAGRVARFVESTPCDAWVICFGTREVLEWFAGQPVPAIALFGQFSKVPIAAACPRKVPSMQTVVRRLVELGHRRIAMTTIPERGFPRPALFEREFIDTVKKHGLPAGAYNLPVIEERSDGLIDCLASLFRLTPPTAIILGDGEHLLATQQFLARRGFRVPEDVSLISTDQAPDYSWCDPPISHLRWDPSPVISQVVRWVGRAVEGKHDIRQRLFDAEFIEGGTIGPANPSMGGNRSPGQNHSR